jgi:hypothetical protein
MSGCHPFQEERISAEEIRWPAMSGRGRPGG